jgi:hypothetical protein
MRKEGESRGKKEQRRRAVKKRGRNMGKELNYIREQKEKKERLKGRSRKRAKERQSTEINKK